MSYTKITIEALIPVSTESVWEYWTNPDHITKWNFASDDWHCPSASNELKVGGLYAARMEAKDGSFGFDLKAIYDDVQELKTLAYTMEDGRKVVTQFETTSEQTRVQTVFDAETENSIEMQRDGWQSILNNFAKYAQSKGN